MSRKRTIPRICEQCGTSFLAAQDRIQAGGARFCGRPCFATSQRRRISTQCAHCATAFEVPPHRAHARFCSKACQVTPSTPTLHEDGTATIPLLMGDGSVRAHVIIDAADAEWAGRYTWSYSAGYAVRARTADDALEQPARIRMHRELLALTAGDGVEGDHINRDRLDNRRGNLRAVSKQGNRQNMPGKVTASSRFRGVSWDRRYGKWAAYVKTHGRRFHLGYFTSVEDAAAAALAGRQRHLPYAVD